MRALFVAVLLGTLVAGASAAERLRGTILAVDRAKSSLTVRHDAFGGMPAMTMIFRTERSEPKGARAGDVIEASVDRSTEPWTLHDVRLRRGAEPPPVGRAALLRVGEPLPHVTLLDQLGRSFALDEPAAVTTAISFIYTRCQDPTMCPLISAKFRRLQDSGAPLRLLEITLDPAYDRPAVLRRYGALFGADPARWRIATGDPKTIFALAERFGISTRVPKPGTIVHTDTLALVDARGRLATLVDGADWTTDQVIAMAKSSSDRNALATLRAAIRSSLVPLCGAATADAIIDRTGRAVIVALSLLPLAGVAAWIAAAARRARA